ncbi:DUF6894 family protein [Pararhizobium arenae]|uniref:DUF6894 family protein n=1 Tax=Pararhizobium arenae TaxID=1856850 RepID=UPI00094B45CB|nr:hypothetical protein [Pararhizobium arenae]
MSRYFFNIRRSGDTALDDEGEDFGNLEDAREHAVNSIRELIAAQIKVGAIVADEHMDICDDAGNTLFSVSFHDVVKDHLAK